MAQDEAAFQVPKRPGRHRGGGLAGPKGRQVEPQAREDLRACLGGVEPRRDLLIEYLHRLQDRFGHLTPQHLAALAEWLRLAQVEVFEVASFYHNFVISTPDGPAPKVKVCDGLSCALAGAEQLRDSLANHLGADTAAATGACMGRCHRAPVVRIGNRYVTEAAVGAVQAALSDDRDPDPASGWIDLSAYREGGGYRLLSDCLTGRMTAEEAIAALDASQLRGLGGAGFPAARKWQFVRAEPAPRYLAVNADESEPGTFKDRYYLLRDPHRMLEGAQIAAHVVGAKRVYIYLRDEYPDVRGVLEAAIAELDGLDLDLVPFELRRGAGAYICGEESAMLESLEGKRGLPRHKPPFPAQIGLHGRPTLINNVETLYWVRDAITGGADWNRTEGRGGSRGLRSFSVSGRVAKPGVYLAPAGITAAELIAEYCGGMAPGHELRAYLPGGASGGILPATMADLPLDFGTLEPHGAIIGSAAIIVLSQADDIGAVVGNLMRFFADESCGQCTPCRLGTAKAAEMLAAGGADPNLLAELANALADTSICGLGQAAANPIRSVLSHFPEALS